MHLERNRGAWRLLVLWSAVLGFGTLGCASLRGRPADSLPLPPGDGVVTRVAFGSCLRQRDPAPILDTVIDWRPELFLWMGDNVYADLAGPDGVRRHGPRQVRQAYQALLAKPEFQRLRAAVPFLATWDDHDYGLNDAGVELPFKAQSQRYFLRYLAHTASPELAQRPGVYDAHVFGPPGRRVQVLLLDTRFFRSPLTPTDEKNAPGKERYLPNPDPHLTLLGPDQWAWLENQLRQPADVRLVVSSVQVIADGHGWERWGNLPTERQRLYDTIRRSGARGVILLSGDRHSGGLYLHPDAVGYPLWEITASSLNAPSRPSATFTPKPEPDAFIQTELYRDENFGTVEIDWGAREVAVTLRDLRGEALHTRRVKFEP